MTDVPRKQELRRLAYDLRNAQPEKASRSQLAVERVLALPAYANARTALWYIDCRSELRTRAAVSAQLSGDKCIVVPFCTVDQAGLPCLGLWSLTSIDELVVGAWNILEPPRERWYDPQKVVKPAQIDIALVPGVAFSRQGARLGNGRGYYDRLLADLRIDCRRVGICFASQLRNDLVVEPHDINMQIVVTEANVYFARPEE